MSVDEQYLTRTVIGPTGRAYDCSTLARLERHLVDLSDSIAKAKVRRDIELVRVYRQDQDRLLERREWLVLTDQVA